MSFNVILKEEEWKTYYGLLRTKPTLQYAVQLIVSMLEQKIQYYGDRGPLDSAQSTYPKNSDVETFVETYIKPIQELQQTLEAIKNSSAPSDAAEQPVPENNYVTLDAHKEDIESIYTLIKSLLDQVEKNNSSLQSIEALNKQSEAQRQIVVEQIKNTVEGIQSQLEADKREREQKAGAEQQRSSELAAQLNGLNARIKDVERERDEQIAAVERDCDQKIGAVERDRDEKVGAAQQRSRELEAQLNSLNARIKDVERERDEQISAAERDHDQQIGAAQQRSRELEAQLNSLNARIKDVERDRDERVAAVERDCDQKIGAVERDRDEKVGAAQQRSRDLEAQLNERIKEIEQDRDQKVAELGRIKAANEAWLNLTGIYRPVLESLQQCSTFKPLLEDNQISTDPSSPGNLFAIATLIGNSIDFAKEVHNCALKVKQTTNEPLTPAEINVYKAINDCYRQLWSIDFDVFVMPGGKSVTEPFTKIPFNKNEVVYMKNPREKTSRYTQAVYVPILKAQNGNIHTLAQVQAGNM